MTIIFDGIAFGMLLFLISVGLSVTLGLMNFVNLAHGVFAMVGGYVCVVLLNDYGVPFLATIPLAIIARMTRSAMLEVLGQDYVRTAKAKGLGPQKVVMKHAFRNALLPIVTIIGLQFGLILSGAILTETIFGLSGVGRSLYEAITARDYPIIQGFVVVIAIGYVFVNLIVDLSYALLDPRIHLD